MSSVRVRRNRKNNLAGLWMQVGILAAIVGVLWILSKAFLIDFIQKQMENNAVLSMILITVIVIAFMTNGLFAFAYSRIALLIEDEPGKFTSNLVPILTDFNLKSFYETNECEGILPFIVIGLSIIKSIIFWGGAVFVNIKYGFLYLYEPHTYWIVASFIAYILYITFKSIVLGIVYASYTDYLTVRLPNLFYVKYIIYIVLLAVYFLALGPLSVFLNFDIPFLQPRLINFLTVILPFLLPVISVCDSCVVRTQVERKLRMDEEDEDYYEDDF